MIPVRTEDRDPRVPALSIVFGYGAMIPIVIGALVTWLAPFPWPIVATSLSVLWAGGILIFLGGVRRGLAFRTPGGERWPQMATTIWLFAVGLAAFLVQTPTGAIAVLLVGYVSVAVLDPIAARREEAPAHFATLRPKQMAVAIVALLALLAWHLTHGGPLQGAVA